MAPEVEAVAGARAGLVVVAGPVTVVEAAMGARA